MLRISPMYKRATNLRVARLYSRVILDFLKSSIGIITLFFQPGPVPKLIVIGVTINKPSWILDRFI
jgi:hypothetical protein